MTPRRLRRGSAVRRTRHAAVLGALCVSAGVTSALASRQGGSPQAAAPTPLELFQKMVPVLRHPRCMNCHGGLDPRAAAHAGHAEVLTGSSCETCHTEADDWSLPHPDHFFVGKTDRQLCAQFAERASRFGFAGFEEHLQDDELIQLGFVGLIGGARDPGVGTPPAPPADPPSGGHRAFVNMGKDWLNQGHGACDVEGTITQEESVHFDSTHHPDPTKDETLQEHATRTVEISLVNGSYRAQILLHGTSTHIVTQRLTDVNNRPCQITITAVSEYVGTTTGPATVRVKDTVYFVGTDASRGQTDYRIDVVLPPERTQRINRDILADTCGSPLVPPPPDTVVSRWPAQKFAIEGHLEDRRVRNLTGGCDKFVRNSNVGKGLPLPIAPCFRFENIGNQHPPWLMHKEAAGSFYDGTEIPVRVVTTWNIAYQPR